MKIRPLEPCQTQGGFGGLRREDLAALLLQQGDHQLQIDETVLHDQDPRRHVCTCFSCKTFGGFRL